MFRFRCSARVLSSPLVAAIGVIAAPAVTSTVAAQNELVPWPSLEFYGECPGEMEVLVRDVTPGGEVALLYGFQPGEFTIPPGRTCAGAPLGIRDPRLVGVEPANADGVALFTGLVAPAACGRVYVQAIDLATCDASNTRELDSSKNVPTGLFCEWVLDCHLVDPPGGQSTDCSDEIRGLVEDYIPKVIYLESCEDRDCPIDTEYWRIDVRWRDAVTGQTGSCWMDVQATRTGDCEPAQASPFRKFSNINGRACRVPPWP